MSTILEMQATNIDARTPTPVSLGAALGGQRIVIRGVAWQAYHLLSEATGENQHIRLAYDGTDLEIMVTSYIHENWKELLAKIVSAVTLGRNIDYASCGETTWNTEGRGIQADLSYYFDPLKIEMARDALARKSMDPSNYPRPDLAIEIDISRPQIDRPAIYSELGVAEVWRYVGGQELVIKHLQTDGSYKTVEASRFLGIRADEILAWMIAEDSSHELAWNRRLNAWARGLRELA